MRNYNSRTGWYTNWAELLKKIGLTVTGTLGVLLKAKSRGIVQEITPLMAEMKHNGFYIDAVLEGFVLEQAGEI